MCSFDGTTAVCKHLIACTGPFPLCSAKFAAALAISCLETSESSAWPDICKACLCTSGKRFLSPCSRAQFAQLCRAVGRATHPGLLDSPALGGFTLPHIDFQSLSRDARLVHMLLAVAGQAHLSGAISILPAKLEWLQGQCIVACMAVFNCTEAWKFWLQRDCPYVSGSVLV